MSPKAIIHQIFNGVCIGMLGLTGFECKIISKKQVLVTLVNLAIGAPVIITRIKPNRFALVLRNLHFSAIVINFMTAFLVLSLIPMETILRGANVLSVLAEVVFFFYSHCQVTAIDIADDRHLEDGCESGSLWMLLSYCAAVYSPVCCD